MKKIMMGLVIAVLATAQLANANTFMDRRALLDKTKSAGKKPIEIGYNSTTTGANKEELFFWANKYWPMVNSMTAQTGDSLSLIPENDSRVLLNLVRAQRYKWLYVNPNIAVVAQEHGYTPLAYLNREFESVFVVPFDSPIKKTAELKGKNIATLANSNDMRLAKYYLHTEGWDAKFLEIGALGYAEVEALMSLKKVDAVAVNREFAVDMLKRNKDAYKILATAGGVPMSVLLAHVSVSDAEVERISGSMLKLPSTILAAANMTFREGEAPFLPFTADHLRYMRAALGFVEPDYGRSIYDPKVDKYIESPEAFTEGIVKPALKTPNP